MNIRKQIATVAASCAVLALAALPAFAQTSITTIRHRNPVTGNVVVRRTVTGPYGATTTVIRHHHRRRHYLRRYHSTTLYMTPRGVHRYYSHGHWYTR